MICSIHIDDLRNITEQQRDDLRKCLTANNLPLTVTESHIVVSADLTHDSAAVQHFNDKLLTSYLQKNVAGLTKHITVSDGAPQHFKLKETVLWISKQFERFKVFRSWVFRGTAHGKDLSDSECGAGVP